MTISLPENDWVKLRQVLMNLEQGIGTGGGGDGTPGADGRPGADGKDGLSTFIIYHQSDLTAMPSVLSVNDSPRTDFYEGKGGWYQTAQAGSNWMSTKRAATINSGDFQTPIPIRGMPGHTVLADCMFRLKLNESGATAYDTSGNDNDGTVSGAIWVTGVKEGGLQFDGIDDTLTVDDADEIDYGVGDITLSAWIKTAQATAGTILTKMASNTGYQLKLTAAGKLEAVIGDGTLKSVVSDAVINSDAWTHIAARFNRDGDCKVYVNGMLSNSDSIAARSGTVSNAENLTFMGNIAGSIDEVMFFNRDLYPDEILALADAGRKIQITEDFRGQKGDTGADAVVYYILPTNGTALKNGVGSLTIEAHKIEGGVDAKLESGVIQLYDDADNELGYSAELDSADIAGSILVTLKDAGDVIYDTITLINVGDGAASEGGNFVDYRFKRSATVPETPAAVIAPEGWSDAPPDGEYPLYMSKVLKIHDGSELVTDAVWSSPVRLDGSQGPAGSQGPTGPQGPIGATGSQGASLMVQYGEEINGPWSTSFDSSKHKYMQTKLTTDASWGQSMRIVGENAIFGSIVSDRGLAWVETSSGWSPSETPIILTASFYRVGSTTPIAYESAQFTLVPETGKVTVALYGPNNADITATYSPGNVIGGSNIQTVTFTHTPSGVKVSESVYAVQKGVDGLDGTSKVPLLSGITFEGNGSNTVIWKAISAAKILYGADEYAITAGTFSTTDPYIYWTVGANSLHGGDKAAATADGNWVICLNDAGVAYPSNGQRLITAGMMQVSSLSAMAANLGDITAGRIVLYGLNGVASTSALSKYRLIIDEGGVKGQWRTVAAADNWGDTIGLDGKILTFGGETATRSSVRKIIDISGNKVKLSFDCFDADEAIPGIGTYQVGTSTAQIEAISNTGSSVSQTRTWEMTNYQNWLSASQRVKLWIGDHFYMNKSTTQVWTKYLVTFFIKLYNSSNTLLGTQNLVVIDAPDTYNGWDSGEFAIATAFPAQVAGQGLKYKLGVTVYGQLSSTPGYSNAGTIKFYGDNAVIQSIVKT